MNSTGRPPSKGPTASSRRSLCAGAGRSPSLEPTKPQPSRVRFEKRNGYTVGISDQPVSEQAIRLGRIPMLTNLAAKHGFKFGTLDGGIKRPAAELIG